VFLIASAIWRFRMKHRLLLSAALLLMAAGVSQAAVIDWGNVGSLRTFKDTNTGRVWLDMDNFFDPTATIGSTPNNMIAIAQNAGFTFATENDVRGLLDSLPLAGGQWPSYAAVMGYGHPRQLIWGTFNDGADPWGWAWAYSNDLIWNYQLDVAPGNVVQNEHTPGAVDMGIWAYQTGQTVPDAGSSLLLLGMSLAGLRACKKRG
jgi:hypothetical protein